MKHIYLFILSIFIISSGYAQPWGPPIPQGNNLEAKGGCDEVEVILVPYYPLVYGQYAGLAQCTEGETHCCLVLTYGIPWEPILKLQKLNSSGNWIYHGGFQVYDQVFGNLEKGTYRVEATMPQIDSSCYTQWEHPPWGFYGPYYVYNTVGQFIGYKGTTLGNVVPYQPPIIYYSDPVLVGPTTSNDIDFEFIQSTGFGTNAYDEGQQVSADASASKNYNLWFLAIKERGGQNRYRSNGWNDGDIDDPIDLTHIWESSSSWEFEAFNTYEVQLAIENRNCRNGIEWPGTSWTVWEESFFVCPSGTGCRFAMNRELNQLQLYPNPATNYVTLGDYQPQLHGSLDLKVFDISGKTRIATTIDEGTVDVSALHPGIYVVKIFHKNNEVHSSRLIIQ